MAGVQIYLWETLLWMTTSEPISVEGWDTPLAGSQQSVTPTRISPLGDGMQGGFDTLRIPENAEYLWLLSGCRTLAQWTRCLSGCSAWQMGQYLAEEAGSRHGHAVQWQQQWLEDAVVPGGDDIGASQSRQVPKVWWYLMSPEEMGAWGLHLIPD